MKKPKRKTKEMLLCVDCKKPIHFDDLLLISKDGIYHRDCCFKIFYQTRDGFLTGIEIKTRAHKK